VRFVCRGSARLAGELPWWRAKKNLSQIELRERPDFPRHAEKPRLAAGRVPCRSSRARSGPVRRTADQGAPLMEPYAIRRELLLTSLLGALPLGLSGAAATASPFNPARTIIKLPDALQWEAQPSFPHGSSDVCPLTGESTAPIQSPPRLWIAACLRSSR